MTWVQWAAVWFIASAVATPFIGSFLAKLRTKREFEEHLATERRRVRLAALVDLADEYDAAVTDKERSRVFRKATDLGFTEDSRPFLLDEQTHPHPKDAA